MDDVRENEMLHIENSELRYTNRALLAQLDEARAALDKATKSEPFILNDELQQLRTSNHYMTEELTRLREERNAEAKDLAEARADVQRFEAALDVANRELAEARKDIATLARSYLKPYARALKQDPDDGGYAATIIEFAGCYSEGETIDEALANIEEAATGWMLAALSMGQTIPEPMKYRRTIRALVVAFRCAMLFVKTADMKWLRAAIKIERGRAHPDNA